jgi:ubiquinol-cytochrome c reductase cytochrome c1 subunit
MVRIIGGLIGLAFAFMALIGFGGSLYGMISDPEKPTAEHEFHLAPKDLKLASDGPFGGYSKNTRQLQRGLQVYKEVCAACHSLRLVSFQDLKGLGYNDAQVKTFAKEFNVPAPNPETGEMSTRPGLVSDKFPLVFANDIAAGAANNNAIPPDLSLITKARHDGAAYVHSLLTGYKDQPKELLAKFPEAKTPKGLHYNPYFPNLNLAMAPPLTTDGQVEYLDGTRSTVDQMAQDVSAFLVWTAEPKLEERHTMGFAVVIFLAIFCFLAYGAYLSVWRNVEH